MYLCDLLENADALKALYSRAQGEVSIREALRELEIWGAGTNFFLTPSLDHAGKEILLIKEWKDLVNQVGDNQSLLQSLKDSPYYEGFADKASLWETRLAELDECLLNLNQVQRRWVYLEPIFGRGALPKEQGRFRRVDGDFRTIMLDVARDSRVVSLTTRQGISQMLATILDQLCRCQKALNEFLEVNLFRGSLSLIKFRLVTYFFPCVSCSGVYELFPCVGEAIRASTILFHWR